MSLFSSDQAHHRIDISATLAGTLSCCAILAWILLPSAGLATWLTRLGAGVALFGAVWILLQRMGTSRFSSLLLGSCVLLFTATYTADQAAELAAWLAMVLVVQEYFINRTTKAKLVAVLAAVAGGLIAAAEGAMGVSMLVVFALLMLTRIVWHAVIERISKKVWVLFSAKALIATGVAIAIYCLLGSHMGTPWDEAQPLRWPHVPLIVLVAAVLLFVRGLWGTLLLKTKRSPSERGLRLYLLLVAVAMLIVVALLRHYADRLFLPVVIANLTTAGWLTFIPETMVVAMVTGLLYIGAGIDRTLFRGNVLAETTATK
jgi:hypothetical protein